MRTRRPNINKYRVLVVNVPLEGVVFRVMRPHCIIRRDDLFPFVDAYSLAEAFAFISRDIAALHPKGF